MSSKSDFNKDDSLNDTISDEESNQNKLLQVMNQIQLLRKLLF